MSPAVRHRNEASLFKADEKYRFIHMDLHDDALCNLKRPISVCAPSQTADFLQLNFSEYIETVFIILCRRNQTQQREKSWELDLTSDELHMHSLVKCLQRVS